MFLFDLTSANFTQEKDHKEKRNLVSTKNLLIGATGIAGVGGSAYLGGKVQENNIKNKIKNNYKKAKKYNDRYEKLEYSHNLETKPVRWLKETYGNDVVDDYFKNKKLTKGYKEPNRITVIQKQIAISKKRNNLLEEAQKLKTSKNIKGKILGSALGAGAVYAGYKLSTLNKNKRENT